MCGIAGIFGHLKPELSKKGLESLAAGLAHRGPDGCGRYEDDELGLVHTRLSIIDLSANGNQPLYNEDNSLVLVCNGELYNYKEIRAGLLARGHKFRSNSDSEVILHLYEENRDDPAQLLELLTGMFAFALWDSRLNKVFLVRDRYGIKPLYYTRTENNQLLFGSEIKAILSYLDDKPVMDYDGLLEYFTFQNFFSDKT